MTYLGKINEFVDWVSGENTWTGQNETGNLPVSGGSIRELLQDRLRNPFVLKEDVENNLYRMFSSETAYQMWVENPSDNADLELFNFVRPSDYKLNITINSSNKFIRSGDSSNLGARIQYTWDIRNDEGEASDSLVATYVITNDATGKTETFTRWYNKGQAVDFSIYEYLLPGTNVVTIIGRGNTTGARNSTTFNIVLLELNVTSLFNFTSKIAPGDNILIPCTFTRNNQDGTARIKMMIDEGGTGKEWQLDVLKNTGVTINADLRIIVNLEPGQHVLLIWAEASYNDGSVTINSNLLYYTFVVATDNISVRKYICIGTSFDSGIFPINNLILLATQYMPQILQWGYYTDAEQTDTQIPIVWKLHESELDENPDVLASVSANSRLRAADLSYIPTVYSQYDESSNPTSYLRATYKNTELIRIPIQVALNKDINVYETGMYALKLSAYGKTNDSYDRSIWEDEEHEIETVFTNIQWNPNSGWYNNAFRTVGTTEYATINHNPFANFDFSRGKTIEIEFETEKVVNDDDVLIRIGSTNGARIEITPIKATLYNNSGKDVVHTNYKSNERSKLAFIINPQSDTIENKLAYIVNNGILERAANAGESAFTYSGEANIKIGGSQSGVRVYNIRVYNYAITYTDAYNNFIYDSDDKLDIVTRNLVLDQADKINFDACKNRLDTILISGNLTNILSGQTNKEDSTTDVTIERICPYDPSKNFKINNVQIRKHGQSTLNYPITSMKFWLNKSKSGVQPVFEITPEDKTQYGKNRYRMKDSSIAQNKFVLLANYADSSGVHNGSIQRLIQQSWYNAKIDGEYKLRTLPLLFTTNELVTHKNPQINDDTDVVDGYSNIPSLSKKQWKDFSNKDFPYDIRISPDSFPCVVFYYDEQGTQERTFLGQYVFMDDKKSDFLYGERSIYKIPTDPFCLTTIHAKDDTSDNKVWTNDNVLRIEVLESNNQYSSYMSTNGFEDRSGSRFGWESAFEMIYPDPDDIQESDAKKGKTKFDSDSKFLKTVKPFIDWYKWLVGTRNNHTKFRQEAAQHLDLYKLAAYYIFALRFGLVDSMERNVQIKTYDGVHFHYEPWDMDIALGNKNDGGIAYDPPINRDTKLPGSLGTYAYSGKSADDNGNIVTSNWLWDALEAWPYWMTTIVPKVADALFVAGLTYENISDMFDNQYANTWCEVIYNKSGFFKYIESGAGDPEWLNWLQGARMTHRHWWLSTSMDYYDAMWFCGDYKNHYIYITANVSEGSGARIRITPNKSTFMTTAINYMTEEQTEVTDEGVTVQGTIPVSPTNILEYEVPNLNTKAPFFVYGANFMDKIDLSEIATGLDAVDVSGVYSTVLGSPLKEINIGVPVTKSGDVYTCTKASLGGSIRGSLQSLKSLQTLNVRGQSNFTDMAAMLYNRDMSEVQNVYAMGSGLTNFFSSQSGNNFNHLELPSTISTFEVHNSTWQQLKFYDTVENGSTLTITEHVTDAGLNGLSTVPANITTLRLMGTSCQNAASINLVRNWLKSIVVETSRQDSEKTLGDYTLEADNIYWTSESVGGSQNLLTYDELELISQLNVTQSSKSIKDSLKGYIVLRNENDTELTTELLTLIRTWFGDTVFSKSSSGLVVDHMLEYTQINLGGDIYIQNGEFYIKEGGRASLSSTKFALAEPGAQEDEGMWSVSYATVNNVEYSTSGLSDRGVSIVSSDQSADGLNYLQTSESLQGSNYNIKVWYVFGDQNVSIVIHIIGVTYPLGLGIITHDTGLMTHKITGNSIIISNNNTALELCTNIAEKQYTATLNTIRYSISNSERTFTYDTKNNIASDSLGDLLLLVSLSSWTDVESITKRGTPALKLECLNGIPLDNTIYEYPISIQVIFASGRTITINGKVLLMKDPVIITSAQSALWGSINTRWQSKYGQNAPNYVRRSDLMYLDGGLVFPTNISSLQSLEGDNVLKYLPVILSLTFDGCTSLALSWYDFSANTELTTLSIQNCTDLTGTIDLSNNTNIDSVNTTNTKLSVTLPVNPTILTLQLGQPSSVSIESPTRLQPDGVTVNNSTSLTTINVVSIPNNKSYSTLANVANIPQSTYATQNLTVLQSNVQETVNSNILDYLFTVAKARPDNTSLSGVLYSATGYSDAVQYLNTKFASSLTVTVPSNGLYFRFMDPQCENILKNKYIFGGDETGVLYNTATTITPSDLIKNEINSMFQNNNNLTVVDLRPYNFYNEYSSDGTLGLEFGPGIIDGSPNANKILIGGIWRYTNRSSAGHTNIIFAARNAKNIVGRGDGGTTSYTKIALKHADTIGPYVFRGVSIDSLYLGDTVPPTLKFEWGDSVNNVLNVYVPQGYGDTYKNDSSWSRFASKIQEWNPANEETIFEGL